MSTQKEEFSGRESDLIEVIWHLIHLNTEKSDWHRQWAQYHLLRATQGMHRYERGDLVCDRLHDAFEAHVGKEGSDAGK